ncbi:MAG: SoxR reducing system RseC family protein [Clostridia bacterium]|nr:SoxR reducing system RseC family protein [Clostridia bacterium]
MTQKGTVIQTANSKALVAIPRASACGEHCASCSGGCQGKGHNVWLENPIGASVGDRVLLSAPTSTVLLSSLFVYFLPLLLFFIGYGVAYSITNSTGLAILVSLLCLAGSILILHICDNKLAPKTEIIEILNPDGSGKDDSHGL